MGKTKERVVFRLIATPCCGHQLCWVNPRLPSYCPECGTNLIGKLGERVMFSDDTAVLELEHG